VLKTAGPTRNPDASAASIREPGPAARAPLQTGYGIEIVFP
jgi:hypothetical protein